MKVNFLILSLYIVASISCQTATNSNTAKEEIENLPEEQLKNETSDGEVALENIKTEEASESSAIEAKFEFKNEIDEFESPSSILYLIYNGKKQEVKTISGHLQDISKAEFGDYQIPPDAIEACMSHWGGGTYFYLISNSSGVDIYEGGPDEESEEESFFWDLYKQY